MKAKVKSKDAVPARYEPADAAAYPVEVEEGGFYFWRIWCRPNCIVYQKFRNGVGLGYLVLPDEKEIFTFEIMINYVENLKSSQVMCIPGMR